jgi:hypothetical protein
MEFPKITKYIVGESSSALALPKIVLHLKSLYMHRRNAKAESTPVIPD